MFRVLIAVAFILGATAASCKAPNPKEGEVRRIRDEEMKVTCWIVMSSGAISCVKDTP